MAKDHMKKGRGKDRSGWTGCAQHKTELVGERELQTFAPPGVD